MLVNIGGDLLVLCSRLATLETRQRIQGTPPPFHHQKLPQKLRKFSYIAKLKHYINESQYQEYRQRYLETVRMLNGLEKTLDKQLDEKSQRWPRSES